MASSIKKVVSIDAPARQIWSILVDMEKFPALMADVESVTVVERTENRTVTEWETSVDGTPVVWTEEDSFFPEQLRIEYKLIEGDLDTFEGYWQITPLGDQCCELELYVEYEFGIPELTNLIGPTLRQKVGENSTMMLAGIKERAEMLAGTV